MKEECGARRGEGWKGEGIMRGRGEGESFKGTVGERGLLKECELKKVKRNKLWAEK